METVDSLQAQPGVQEKAIALGLVQYGASPVQGDIDDPEKKHNGSRERVRYDCGGLYSF
jgi:hypothetical protein